MRHLATIREIKEIRPISRADKLVLAIVDGWECVVSKEDNLKAGDKVIYIEIDSILPPKPEFEFLKDRKYRVKTIKLRGQISQGLVLPISKFLKGDRLLGEDVTDELGIKKYDPEAIQEKKFINNNDHIIAAQPFYIKFLMRFSWFRYLAKKFDWFATMAPFPDFIKKTDEERIQNLPELFEEIKENQIKLSVTEKIDGTSSTFYLKGNEYGICSRNKKLLHPEKETSWLKSYYNVFERYRLRKVLKDIHTRFSANLVVIQGEIVGPKIQKNKYSLNEYDLLVFNIIVDGQKMDNSTCRRLCIEHSLKMVPIIYDQFIVPKEYDISDLVDKSKGISVIRPDGGQREGLVFRNIDEDISFKVINPLFLLKEQ